MFTKLQIAVAQSHGFKMIEVAGRPVLEREVDGVCTRIGYSEDRGFVTCVTQGPLSSLVSGDTHATFQRAFFSVK